MTRFNIPAEVWDRAVDELYELLVEVARRPDPTATITYGEVVGQLRTVTLEPDARAFHDLLGEVSTRAFDDGAPLLSAVVVHKDDRRPGGGFCRLARSLGFQIADDPEAEDIFWAKQLEEVHHWWRRR